MMGSSQEIYIESSVNGGADRQTLKESFRQGRSQNFPVGGDDEILANWQIEMLQSDVCSVAREKFGVGFLEGLHLIWSILLRFTFLSVKDHLDWI